MKNIFLGLLLSGFVGLAHSNCQVAENLIDKYGISFSGFKKEIPKLQEPLLHGMRSTDLILIPLKNKRGMVPDGFSHSALINIAEKKVWIKRTGGFATSLEWYGPINLNNIDLKGCKQEAYKSS